MAERLVGLLKDRQRAAAMGRAGREQVIARWSIDRTVEGYQDLIAGIYTAKAQRPPSRKSPGSGNWRESPTLGRP
jgi:hypothetical protein